MYFDYESIAVQVPDDRYTFEFSIRRALRVRMTVATKVRLVAMAFLIEAVTAAILGIVFHSVIGYGAIGLLPAAIILICSMDFQEYHTVKDLLSKPLLNKIRMFNSAVKSRTYADKFIRESVPPEEYQAELKSWKRQRDELTEALKTEYALVKRNLDIVCNRATIRQVEKHLSKIENCAVTDTIDYSRYISIVRAKDKLGKMQ